jgi:hypothetical protein
MREEQFIKLTASLQTIYNGMILSALGIIITLFIML